MWRQLSMESPLLQWPSLLLNFNVDDDDAFGLEVIIQSFGAVLAADAARFDAAEGQLIVAVVKRVDPNVAGLELVDRFVGVNKLRVQIDEPRPNSEALAFSMASSRVLKV